MKRDMVSQCTGLEWNVHNAEKLRARHGVTPTECEQAFFNLPLVVEDDVLHSESENRYYSLGQTDAGRPLFLVFTIRKEKIRVISARTMSKRERRLYQEHEKKDTSV
jgi:uncharacterized protein